jgi:serine/threonine protein kinase
VTEFCNEGDMQKFLDKRGRLSEEEATDVLKQILNGFKGLHEVKAMHRDFKLANLLVHNKVVKIADLGFAKQLEKEHSLTKTQLGTGVTMAPEVLDGKEYGMYADIWSIGIVYYQMLHGVYPFNGQSDVEIRRKIERRIIPYSKSIKISDNARDFI